MITAILLGIVEGLTEFLPVSSTGHLILFGNLLGFTGPRASSFEVFIQLGAILAVVVLYRQRFRQFFSMRQEGLSGLSGLQLLVLTTLPAVIAGFFLHGFIKERLFSPVVVAAGLFIGGIALITMERFYKPAHEADIEQTTKQQAFKIGLFQLLALSPGISRAGATIVGGRLVGLSRKAAVEYSFLVAVPVMIAAVSYDLIRNLPALTGNDVGLFVAGFLTAFISALIAIKFFIRLVQRYTLEPFGWYRVGLSVVVLFSLVLF